MTEHPFLAVDGEACEDDYVLMHRTGSHPLTDVRPGGLHSVACLEFLLQAPKPSIQVCFGLGYDVNNWLRDVPKATLARLWETQQCHWRDYRIEWVPKCWFIVSHISGRSAKVYEVFGFFQSSFVKALEAWEIGAPEEIRRMKAERGSFRRADLEAVTRYCALECDYLVELMGALRSACGDAGFLPSSWHGAGAAAAALLKAHDVASYHRHDLELTSEHVAEDVVQGAYYGGRVELLHQGVHHHVIAADIKSAYPAAMVELPSLKGARLNKRVAFDPERFGVWRVSWSCPKGTTIAPFPVRVKQSIFYPLSGEGTYHTVEVAAALALGYPIDVHWGWVLDGPQTKVRPFEWIPRVFDKRAQYKAEGRAAEKAIKLALNSCYGKLAQGPSKFVPTPQFQSYLWAGHITAATRAKVLTAAALADDPIMIATDGIYAKGFTGLGEGGGLGTWEQGEVDKLFAAQAGVYAATMYSHDPDETGRCRRCRSEHPTGDCLSAKSRGFFASEIDYGELEEGWEREGPDHVHHYRSTRFQGLGSSLSRREFGVWREWRTEPRSIVLWPERKIYGEGGRLLPFPGRLTSEPYRPKISLVEAKALESMEGIDQPMVIEI